MAPRSFSARHFLGGHSDRFRPAAVRAPAGRAIRSPQWTCAAAALAVSCLDSFLIVGPALVEGRPYKIQAILASPALLSRFCDRLRERRWT